MEQFAKKLALFEQQTLVSRQMLTAIRVVQPTSTEAEPETPVFRTSRRAPEAERLEPLILRNAYTAVVEEVVLSMAKADRILFGPDNVPQVEMPKTRNAT